MRSEQEVNRAIEEYADMVKRICVLHLKNDADTEDIFQTVFLRYALHTAPFRGPEHEKAWLIRVTLNACRDLLRSFFRSRTIPQQADEAHALGLSCGKYRAYQEVLACTDAYSAQEIGAMTMRQIRDLLAQLQAEDSPAAGSGNGQGSGQGSGQGNGHRYGRT